MDQLVGEEGDIVYMMTYAEIQDSPDKTGCTPNSYPFYGMDVMLTGKTLFTDVRHTVDVKNIQTGDMNHVRSCWLLPLKLKDINPWL